MASTPELQTLINFYARAGMYRHIQAACNDALKKRGDDPVLLYWRAFGLIFEGNYYDSPFFSFFFVYAYVTNVHYLYYHIRIV